MKLCQPHWDQLKDAIASRDVMRFVANNGQDAIARLEAQLQPGSDPQEQFEPLLNANFAIWSNALEMGGLYLLGGDEAGNPYCPICESEAHGSHSADWWINHAADEQVERARALGLLPKASLQ